MFVDPQKLCSLLKPWNMAWHQYFAHINEAIKAKAEGIF